MSIYTEFQLYRIQQLSISKTVLVWAMGQDAGPPPAPAPTDQVEYWLFRGRGTPEAGGEGAAREEGGGT